jgi:hypothetical protein
VVTAAASVGTAAFIPTVLGRVLRSPSVVDYQMMVSELRVENERRRASEEDLRVKNARIADRVVELEQIVLHKAWVHGTRTDLAELRQKVVMVRDSAERDVKEPCGERMAASTS